VVHKPVLRWGRTGTTGEKHSQMHNKIVYMTLIAFAVPLFGLLMFWGCRPQAILYSQAQAAAVGGDGVGAVAAYDKAHSSLRQGETQQHTVVISANVNVVIPPPAPVGSIYPEPTAVPTTGRLTEAVRSPRAPALEMPQSTPATSPPSAEPTKVVVPGDFIARIKEHIRVVEDVVYINRFYSEHNLSFAKKAEYLYRGKDGAASAGNQSSYSIASLSEDGVPVTAPFAQGVHPLAWSRNWFKENYLTQKSGFAPNFQAVAVQIRKLRKSYNVPLPAIRYHTYTPYCKMIKSLGSPSVLPIPVMWTFRIHTEGGHFSGDTTGKTCLHGSPGDNCVVTSAAQSLERCGESLEKFQKLLDSPKFLLLVTNQHQSVIHEKLLSLPMGVERPMAGEIMKFYNRRGNFPAERNILVAISNYFGQYSTRVRVIER
jgi:hypothetical protein